jgi:hypothetical protein
MTLDALSSKLYRLTGEGHYRIEPELGMGPTCALIQRDLLGCVREGITDSDEIQDRFEAAESLHLWFRHPAGIDRTSTILAAAAEGIKKLYLESGEGVRTAKPEFWSMHRKRPPFVPISRNGVLIRVSRLRGKRSNGGRPHPDYVAGLFERLRGKDSAPRPPWRKSLVCIAVGSLTRVDVVYRRCWARRLSWVLVLAGEQAATLGL